MTIGAATIGSRPIGSNPQAYVPITVVIQDGLHTLSNDIPTVVPHDGLVISECFHGVTSDVVVPGIFTPLLLNVTIAQAERFEAQAFEQPYMITVQADPLTAEAMNPNLTTSAKAEAFVTTGRA